MTPDEIAFLKAIGDNPADETARLVYADWLADRNDPRAEFARLSADFLRCTRGLADTRRALPAKWLGAVDPLFDRFQIVRLANPGEGIAGGTVTGVFVTPGCSVALRQALVEVSTDKAIMEIPADHPGVIVSILVRPGDFIAVGQALLVYLSSQDPFPPSAAPAPVPAPRPSPDRATEPKVPLEPLAEFIHDMERGRDSLRTALPEQINAILVYLETAARMVFGRGAVRVAWDTARANRGWHLLSMRPTTQMRSSGLTDEQVLQERLDIHIEMFRVFLRTHGQPVEFRELPDPFDGTSPATE